VLLFRAFKNTPATEGIASSVFYSMAVVVFFALGDEFHQSFVSSRTSSIVDVGIDAIGGSIAQCVCIVWNHLRRESAHQPASS
jgi:VanZ family protein